jgi:hypothetical protein
VVDDTSDLRIGVTLGLAGGELGCHANVTVGPPDFGPDRRPFLSAADEINDRQHDPARDAALTPAQRADWVEDLFERVFETVSLLDVDFFRLVNGRTLAGSELRAAIPGDGLPQPTIALGARDARRDAAVAVPAPTAENPRTLSQRSRDRHRDLADIALLEAWVRTNPTRIGQLIRPPLRSDPDDPGGQNQTMRMPPFMRNSNARALTLGRWQYDLLMAWVASVTGPGAGVADATADAARAADTASAADADAAEAKAGAELSLTSLSGRAAARRNQVLAALEGRP